MNKELELIKFILDKDNSYFTNILYDLIISKDEIVLYELDEFIDILLGKLYKKYLAYLKEKNYYGN